VQVAFERAKFVTGFSQWVKGRLRGWSRAVSSYGSTGFNLDSPTSAGKASVAPATMVNAVG
jgi:hypothetical protein